MSYRKYSNLCVELKFLYVAVTRAKNRVIIYDNYESKRKPVLDYWSKMGVTHVVTK
jgi:ATP-dependent exoDNAse (exonuclease V) beta subunit